jgi:hypothetical protein
MSIVFQQILLLLLIAILQRSFFDVLWPGFDAPSLIIATTIALVFVQGFARSLRWVLLLVFLHALLGNSGLQGLFPVTAVGIAYATSFLSRRLLIERHMESGLALGLFSALMALGYSLFFALWQQAIISVAAIVGNALLAFLLLPLVLTVLRIREERIRFSLMSEFRGMRT